MPADQTALTANIGFLSYSHQDNVHMRGYVHQFHKRLSAEVELQTGEPFQIFIDRTHIEWGDAWRRRIQESLDSSAFLIPILTEGFFKSAECAREVLQFRARESKLDMPDRVLPIQLAYCRALENKVDRASNGVLDYLMSRQYCDWRHLRFESEDSADLGREYERLALRIAALLEKHPTAESRRDGAQSNGSKKVPRQTSYEDLLDEPLSFDSLMKYAAYKVPDRQPSPVWTDRILADIDKGKYQTIGDVDEVAMRVWDHVLKYSRKRPALFQWSTDFISKALIFADAAFRARHPVSPSTMAEAQLFVSSPGQVPAGGASAESQSVSDGIGTRASSRRSVKGSNQTRASQVVRPRSPLRSTRR